MLFSFAPAGGVRADSSINAVLGDESWRAREGRDPDARDDSAERIRAHLRYVIDALRASVPSDPTRARRRLALLDSLAGYAERARFPRNVRYPGRRPRFIDDRGRPCAVGYLVIESGHASLARRIREAHEYDYVDEIATGPLGSELASWAGEHGFTARELAMIQPTYGFEEIERAPLTEPDLRRFVQQVELAVKLCMREHLGTRASELRIALTVRRTEPGETVASDPANPIDARAAEVVRTLDVSATPALSRAAEACIREPIEYFYRNLGIHYLPPAEPMSVAFTYRNINALDELRAREIARARTRMQSLLEARRAQIEACRPSYRLDPRRPTTFHFYLMPDGAVVLEAADNGAESECLSHALGLGSAPDPWPYTAEPFTASARFRFGPTLTWRDRGPDY
jgi:hypothetical protein